MISRTPVNEPAEHAGGLSLPPGVGISIPELQGIVDNFTTLEGVEAKVSEMGLRPGDKPVVGLPEITPEALTTVDSREYTTLYAKQLAWLNYITPHLVQAKCRLMEAKNCLKLVEQKLRSDMQKTNRILEKAQRMTAAEIETEVDTDPSRIQLFNDQQRAEQMHLTLSGYAEIAERNMSVISRQVEIRRQELEGGQRESNMPSRGFYRPPGR